MQRGILQLNKEELLFIQKEFNQASDLFKQKLQAALQADSALVQLEISKDEVESILDILPPPTGGNTLEDQIRYKLSAFLK